MRDANESSSGGWSLARDWGRFGDVCPADSAAAHPWLAEIHALSSKAGDTMLTGVEQTLEYVARNPSSPLAV